MIPRRAVFRGRRSLFLLACACLSSCFDSPIQESLRLRFLADGSVVVTSSVAIDAYAGSGNAALADTWELSLPPA